MDFSAGAPMGSMSKVHLVYESAFWRDHCLSGSMAGNLGRKNDDVKLCQFVADSSPPGSKPGILTTFIAADVNEELTRDLAVLATRLAREGVGKEQIQIAIQQVVREMVVKDLILYFGDDYKAALENVKESVYYNWDTKQYTGGAFTAYLKPGIWTSCAKNGWREPIGDVFWAGTETADRWPGYFDGAVRAGKAAAARVLAKYYWPTGDEQSCPTPPKT